MCGIFGYIGPAAGRINTASVLETLRHRGPDDQGHVLLDNILLAHTRLSIIDLSTAGRQPMSDPAGNVWVVLNGEIYNYLELKQELHGFEFRSSSDTEVILAAYEKWGESFLQRLRGMFALGLYDIRTRKLIVAIDRFGIKPCYYHLGDDNFCFGSEVKGLRAAGVSLNPDDATIFSYLANGLLNNSERTFFDGISQLPPAHYLVYEDGKISLHRYWELRDQEPQAVSEGEMIDFIDEQLRESVRVHMRSDVEYGLSLSSGLDSNLLRCMVDEIGDLRHPLNCYSFCYTGTPYDECADLDEVDISGITYHKAHVTSDRLLEDLPGIISSQEGPIGGAGIYAFWHTMKMARDTGVKVILNGQGADELFCGYRYYYWLWLQELHESGDRQRLALELENYNREHGTTLTETSDEFLGIVAPGRNLTMRAADGTALDRHGYLTEAFSSAQGGVQFVGSDRYGTLTKNRMYNDLRYIKIPKLLRFQDKTSMCWGVEVRVPFLDHVLFEKIFNLPTDTMIQKGLTKYLLRKVADKYDDPASRYYKEPIKKYMPTPQREWLKYELCDPIREMIGSSILHDRGYIDKHKLMKIYNNFTQEKGLSNSYFIWKFINMEMFFRVFIT